MTMEGTESGFPYFSFEIYVSFRFWTGANLFWVKPRGGKAHPGRLWGMRASRVRHLHPRRW